MNNRWRNIMFNAKVIISTLIIAVSVSCSYGKEPKKYNPSATIIIKEIDGLEWSTMKLVAIDTSESKLLEKEIKKDDYNELKFNFHNFGNMRFQITFYDEDGFDILSSEYNPCKEKNNEIKIKPGLNLLDIAVCDSVGNEVNSEGVTPNEEDVFSTLDTGCDSTNKNIFELCFSEELPLSLVPIIDIYNLSSAEDVLEYDNREIIAYNIDLDQSTDRIWKYEYSNNYFYDKFVSEDLLFPNVIIVDKDFNNIEYSSRKCTDIDPERYAYKWEKNNLVSNSNNIIKLCSSDEENDPIYAKIQISKEPQ